MNLPERIFAIGGAGKAITMRLLQSDWVLEGVLEPRPNPQSVTVTFIDTAQGEENSDRQRIQELRQRINEKQDELRDPNKGRTGEITVEYKLVTKDIQLSGQIDLLGDSVVPNIAAGNGMDEENWWLKDRHINENLDFAKGVVRKRGLGKAIYYKAYAEDDQLSSYIDLPDKGKVAVIAGLGGGTGSGILLDLVQHLQQKQRTAEITLFGVLPNHTEGIEENTNAFAALSEIEYLSLTEANLFKDRILLPIDPTGFDGKTGNRIHTGQFLEELDEAAIYMICSYYNTEGLEDPFAGTPSYAPFTIGVPQVLRYNVEAINDARESLREILSKKEDALEAEKEVYAEVDRFLSKHYGVDAAQNTSLRDMDRADLEDRLDSVRTLTEFDLFEELQYESLNIFNDLLREADDESEDISEAIDILSGSLRAGAVTASSDSQPFVDNIDELLADILEQDIRLIGRRKELLKKMKAVETSQVRDTLEYLLVLGDENVNPGVRLNRLETKLRDSERRKERLEEELDQTEQELKDVKQERSSEIQHKLQNWEQKVQADVERYNELQQLQLDERLNTLENELESFCSQVVQADEKSAVENVSSREVEQAVNALVNDLDNVGIRVDDEINNIQNTLAALKRAKIAFLEMNAEEGTVEKVLPWKNDTEEQRKQGHKEYQLKKGKIDDTTIFNLGPAGTSFRAEVTFDTETIRSDERRQAKRLRSSIADHLRTSVDIPAEEYVDDLEVRLDNGADVDALSDVAERAFRAEASGTSEIEQRTSELESELQTVSDQLDLYESSVQLFENLNNRRSSFVDNRDSFLRQRNQYGEERNQSVSTQEEEYVYVKNVQPNDVLRTTGDADIAESDLFNSRDEVQRLHGNLSELARNARNQQYTGLKRRKFSSGRTRYGDLKIRVAVLSRAINQIDSEALDFEDTFQGAFDIGASGNRVNSPFTTWKSDVGDSWDIGLSVFITGVFLDNIRKTVEADGYHSGYRTQKDKLDDDILIHHSLGLDQGYYVRRADVLNMESEDDVDFYLRSEPDIVNDLLNNYIERVEIGNVEPEVGEEIEENKEDN